MADERDLELLDDYLSNRMGGADRSEFEQKLQADPDLQNEYALQKNLVEGLRGARAAELKSMLNQVPVPSGGHGSAFTSKAFLGAVTIIIAAATYWFLTRDQTQTEQPTTAAEQKITEQPVAPSREAEAKDQALEEASVQNEGAEPDKNQTSAGTEHSKPSLAGKPDPLGAPVEKNKDKKSVTEPVLDVFDPGADEEPSEAGKTGDIRGTLRPGNSSLIVETDRENSRYSFNYQFRNGKLFLYGPFEKNLYEILEFFTDEKRTVFLYYNAHYFLLKEADSQVRPLTPITDTTLLRKLDEYRSSK